MHNGAIQNENRRRIAPPPVRIVLPGNFRRAG